MKPDYLTVVLGSMVITFVASVVGHYFGARDKVSKEACNERRFMCNKLLTEKINHLIDSVKKLEDKFDKFTIG